MKLSRTSWLLITIGFLVITSGSLGAVGWQLTQQRNQLNGELASMEARLNGSQAGQSALQQEVMEMRTSQTLPGLETTKAMFSQPSWSITTTTLFDIAEVCGVEITEVSSSGLTKDVLAEIPCLVQTLTVKIGGDLLGLVNFITQLNYSLETGVVKSVVINVPETTGDEAKPSADIGLIIYTSQGDQP